MADTKISGLTAAGAAAAANELAINEAGTSKKLTVQQLADFLFKRINGNSGAAGAYKTLQKLSANATANATTTLATVMTTTGVGAGTWHFKYTLFYQCGATSTGVDFALGHSGTTTKRIISSWFVTSGGAAANALADQVTSNTANLVEGKSQRGGAAKLGASLGVDTINADMMMVIEGVVVVTVSGDLTLQHASSVAASSQVMAESCLELTKVG